MMTHLLRKILLLVIFFGIYLRFYYGLSTELWGDEAISFFIAKDVAWSDLFFNSAIIDPVHPPLYYLFLKLTLLFTWNDTVLRLSSLIWFFPSLYLVFLIGKKNLTSIQTFFALSLFSSHPLLINLAFQVRPYALAIFLSLAAIYSLILHLQEPTLKRAVLLGLCLGLGFLTSYATIWLLSVIVTTIVIQVLTQRTLMFARNYYYSILIFLMLSGWQITTLFRVLFERFFHGFPIAHSVFAFNWQWFLQELNLLVGMKLEILSLSILLIIPLVFIFKHRSKTDWFFLALFAGTVLIAVLASSFFSPVFLARQLFVATIGLIFVLSKLTSHLRSKFLIFMIVCTYAYFSFHQYGFLFQAGIDNGVKKYVRSGDLVVSFENNLDYLKYYLFVNHKQVDVLTISPDLPTSQKILSDALKENYKGIVFFANYCPNQDYDHCRSVLQVLQTQFCQQLSCKITD